MAFEMKDMSGSLFVNQRKRNDRDPDFTGKIIINGSTYRISAWKRQSKDGSKNYLNLAVRQLNGDEADSNRADPFDL